MDELAVVRRRLRAQRLAGTALASPAAALAWLGALQAQEFAEAKWSVAERVRDCTDAAVEAAFAPRRDPPHASAAPDVALRRRRRHPLAAGPDRAARPRPQPPHVPPRGARSRDARAGRGRDRAELADGEPRTRPELAAALARAGIAAAGFRLGYLLMHAELEGLVCSGPRRGRRAHLRTAGAARPGAAGLPRDATLAELTRRFFRSRGPATLHDFTTWSSLTMADARAGLALVGDELERLELLGTTWYAAPEDTPRRGRTGAFLIPMYDELTIGYRDLRVVLAAPAPGGSSGRSSSRAAPWAPGSARSPAVRRRRRDAVRAAGEAALRPAVRRFGRFLGLPAELRVSR